MSYAVEYIDCKVCGSDRTRLLGIRGNLEYAGAAGLTPGRKHMVTSVVRCRRCGFVYANPMIILPDALKAEFYNRPEEYHSSVCADSLKIFNNTLDLIEEFNEGKKGRLLDIGCGKGEFLAAARNRQWEVSGVEPSANFVRYASEKFGLEVRNSTLEEAGFAENLFDVVTLNMVLEHVDEPHKLLSNSHKVLKRGGLLYIEVPNMDSMLLKLIRFYFRLKERDWAPHISPLHYPYHCYGYGRRALELLCRMNGFAVKRIFVFDIGLRGFRSCGQAGKLKEKIRAVLAKCFGLIKQGDILIAVAVKQ